MVRGIWRCSALLQQIEVRCDRTGRRRQCGGPVEVGAPGALTAPLDLSRDFRYAHAESRGAWARSSGPGAHPHPRLDAGSVGASGGNPPLTATYARQPSPPRTPKRQLRGQDFATRVRVAPRGGRGCELLERRPIGLFGAARAVREFAAASPSGPSWAQMSSVRGRSVQILRWRAWRDDACHGTLCTCSPACSSVTPRVFLAWPRQSSSSRVRRRCCLRLPTRLLAQAGANLTPLGLHLAAVPSPPPTNRPRAVTDRTRVRACQQACVRVSCCAPSTIYHYHIAEEFPGIPRWHVFEPTEE
jgi:hypothetical protein